MSIVIVSVEQESCKIVCTAPRQLASANYIDGIHKYANMHRAIALNSYPPLVDPKENMKWDAKPAGCVCTFADHQSTGVLLLRHWPAAE